METRIKPVPAFYCCYLLRSTIRHSSLYIGSSPHPSRRLAQHNGKAKGGAVRTSRASLRPWEMVCIVAGFPSNIAALQFEWAWHNTHLTRHIASEDRISLPTTRIKTNAKTGKTRKKLGRPRTSLIDKLSNLHLLLRAPYFAKWPLELRFFNQKVHRTWLTWSERVDGQIRSDIPVLLDLMQPTEEDVEPSSAQKPAKTRKADLIGKGGVEGVDPTYARFQAALHKLNDRIAQTADPLVCDVCELPINSKTDLFNICLDEDCTSVTHVTCLSQYFLRKDGPGTLVPKQGNCPSCRSTVKWLDLMRLLSLRLRAEKEVKKLLKKRGRGAAAIAAELLEEDDDHTVTEDNSSVEEDPDASDQDEMASIASMGSVHSVTHPLSPLVSLNNDRNEIVIEDSEDER